ncbi:beta-galactosidase [uncultured Victivallis sp.]|uniref:beta-galactosidase n=1 Tax=uncultured Victivallis sp. TaxID=354118 RepID=UPI0025EFD907|nr:beta-galactosidase [uncultured Victivallis sp.]
MWKHLIARLLLPQLLIIGSLSGSEVYELATSRPPDSGSVENLPASWTGGSARPEAVTLSVRLEKGDRLSKIVLTSRSPNKWWFISGVTLEGVREGEAVKLADETWYSRGEDNSSKEFSLTLNPGGESFPEYRIILRRPHCYIHMQLMKLELFFANRIRAEVLPRRTLARTGEKLSESMKLDNPFPSPAAGTLRLLSGDRTVWEKFLTIPSGTSEVPWEFTLGKPEEFRLDVRFDSKEKLFSVCSGPIRIMPERSPYRMSIGTAHGSAQSGALGFTVRHDWSDINNVSDQSLSAGVRNDSLFLSHCNVNFETDEDGRFMVNADGETLKNIAMHVPRRLGEKTARVLDSLNGHPGLEEVVYYNEHGYHTWQVKGLADYSKHTMRLYRDWLKKRYGHIAKLNQLYGSEFRDFSEVEPPRKFTGPAADWFDWMEFRRYSVAEYFREAYRLLKPHLPDTPLSPKPINFDYYAASTATDPWLFRDACDFYGYDLYPFQREGYLDPVMSLDFHRTQVGDKTLKFLESNFEFRRVNQTEKTAADMHLLYMPAFLHGLKGVYFYCWHQPWTENHRGFWLREGDGVLTPQGRGAAQVAKAAQTLAPVLMTGRVLPATAAVYFPWEEISQTPNVAPISALRGAYKLMR